MSFILDALRKSDQQRQRGSAPTLLTAQAAAIGTKRPSLMAYGTLGGVLLATGIVIGWLRPWQERVAPVPPSPPKPISTPSRPEPETAQRPSAAPSAPAPQAAVPDKSPSPGADAIPKSSGQQEAGTPASAQTAKTVPEQRPKQATEKPRAPLSQAVAISSRPPQPAQVPAVNADGSSGASEQPPPWMTELPVEVQRDLPAMHVMVHAYSARPADRLVGINNKLLHEGDEVAPGLKLEQITPEGMVLNFKGQVFRRGVH
jgi:general secretion pathway protein B